MLEIDLEIDAFMSTRRYLSFVSFDYNLYLHLFLNFVEQILINMLVILNYDKSIELS